jgi:hypothetical protein
VIAKARSAMPTTKENPMNEQREIGAFDTATTVRGPAEDGFTPQRGGIPCSEHGHRRPWVVCEHIESALEESGEAVDYRLYRVRWLHEGTATMTSEYRLCYPCAEAVGLTAEHVDAERATDLLEDRLACVCSACALALLAPATARPLLVEARL